MEREVVEKYALENAVNYEGEANVGSVVGSVIQEVPEAKKGIDELKELAAEVVAEVNKLSLEGQLERLQDLAPELLEEEKEEKDIFSAFEEESEGEVVTAFPPEPSKYPHIGHAKSLFVNYEFAKRNDGKFVLRFEDTNPELAKEEFYDIHLGDYEWLGAEPDEVDCASDHMEEFYEYAEKLIGDGNAYVCTCSQEEISEMRKTGEPVECRGKSVEKNMDDWKAMLDGDLDDAVLLAKIDLEHKNSTMRDPTLFRIIEKEHARQGTKYRVWPNYDFQAAVMDALEGVTLRFRTKEFELRSELQRHLQECLDLKVTGTYEFARFELEDVETSGRVIREAVESGDLIGWDDPSLATIAALRRRGFQPKAIKDFVLSTGLSKSESTVTWNDLILHNRRVLNEEAERYFFIDDPVRIEIEGAPEQEIDLHLHPEEKEGGRPMKTHEDFFIAKKDFEALKEGGFYRFMECLNFTKEGGGFEFHSTDYEKYRDKGDRIMHFLPFDEEVVKAEVLMPDKTVREGLAEKGIADLEVGDVIQFERFGFCRLDEKEEDVLKFWFTHD